MKQFEKNKAPLKKKLKLQKDTIDKQVRRKRGQKTTMELIVYELLKTFLHVFWKAVV